MNESEHKDLEDKPTTSENSEVEENKESDVNFTMAKEDNLEAKIAVEERNDEKGLTLFKEKEKKINRNNVKITIGIICFLAIVCVFASRDFVNTKATTSTINKVINTAITKVNTRDVKRGVIMNAKEVYANNVNSVVEIKTEINKTLEGQIATGAASGTGFIISKDGYILTNNHVIENGTKIKVSLYDGKSYDATLIGTDPELDIAVLKINSSALKPVTFGDSDKLIIGEDIYTIGHPLGQFTYTFTNGIVSAKNRTIALDSLVSLNMFQTNTAMNSGNSGGPIFNSYGEVIGIATAKYASDNVEGIVFGIPINDVMDNVKQIMENGRVIDKAYLGIVVTSILEKESKEKKIPIGAYISEITKDSAGDKAGLKHGDIVVKVDKHDILTNSDLINIKKKYKAGNVAIFKVWRSGEYLEINLKFGIYDKTAEDTVKKFQKEQLTEQTNKPKEPTINPDTES